MQPHNALLSEQYRQQNSDFLLRGYSLIFQLVSTAKWINNSRLSYGVPDAEIVKVLEPYGKIRLIKSEVYSRVYTGVRNVFMKLSFDISAHVRIAGHACIIHYKGQPTICFVCGKHGHMKSKCPDLKSRDDPPPPLIEDPVVVDEGMVATHVELSVIKPCVEVQNETTTVKPSTIVRTKTTSVESSTLVKRETTTIDPSLDLISAPEPTLSSPSDAAKPTVIIPPIPTRKKDRSRKHSSKKHSSSLHDRSRLPILPSTDSSDSEYNTSDEHFETVNPMDAPPSDDTTSSVTGPVVSSPPIAPFLLSTIEESPLTQFMPNLPCPTQDRW